MPFSAVMLIAEHLACKNSTVVISNSVLPGVTFHGCDLICCVTFWGPDKTCYVIFGDLTFGDLT